MDFEQKLKINRIDSSSNSSTQEFIFSYPSLLGLDFNFNIVEHCYVFVYEYYYFVLMI